MTDETITLAFEDAQRIFDLAVGADDACSGYMDSDDTAAMRRLAEAIGADPSVCTGAEFEAQYPHAFTPVDPEKHRRLVAVRTSGQAGWDSRPESDDEMAARLGFMPGKVCEIGRWKGRCGKPEGDPIHQATATRG